MTSVIRANIVQNGNVETAGIHDNSFILSDNDWKVVEAAVAIKAGRYGVRNVKLKPVNKQKCLLEGTAPTYHAKQVAFNVAKEEIEFITGKKYSGQITGNHIEVS